PDPPIHDGDQDDHPRALHVERPTQAEHHHPLVLRHDLDGRRQEDQQQQDADPDADVRPGHDTPPATRSTTGSTRNVNPPTPITVTGVPAGTTAPLDSAVHRSPATCTTPFGSRTLVTTP